MRVLTTADPGIEATSRQRETSDRLVRLPSAIQPREGSRLKSVTTTNRFVVNSVPLDKIGWPPLTRGQKFYEGNPHIVADLSARAPALYPITLLPGPSGIWRTLKRSLWNLGEQTRQAQGLRRRELPCCGAPLPKPAGGTASGFSGVLTSAGTPPQGGPFDTLYPEQFWGGSASGAVLMA